MKIGLPRQNTLITWPSATGARSTSIGAPAAMVEASGFICAINGTSAAAAPTAPTAPVAMKRKSRRVGSAEDVIVTVRLLLVLAMKPLALETLWGDKFHPEGRQADRPASLEIGRRSFPAAFYWHPW